MRVGHSTIAAERASADEWLPPWTQAEHDARYRFAATYVRNKVVVDCACGNGLGSTFFLRSYPQYLYGIDSDREAVERAAVINNMPNVSFAYGDATDLPIESSSSDLFISLETIEHIHNAEAFVAEAARVLRQDGLFICSTPNRLVTNPGTLLASQPWNPYHVREYSPQEFGMLLSKHFNIEGAYGQNPTWAVRITALGLLGRHIHPILPVRINQLWKCRWFIFPQRHLHEVRPCEANHAYEYLVFLCRKKTGS